MKKKLKQVVIIVPGLSDGTGGLSFVTRNWLKTYGILPVIFPMSWREKNEKYENKLKRVVQQIDKLYTKGYSVSLLGTSAGGSAAINAFCKRKSKIYKVINICGRLRRGERVYPSLELAAKSSPAFKESVLQCEKNLGNLSKEDTKKIVTLRPLIDEIVPVSLVSVPGATNIQIISVGHVLSISLALTLYSGKIIDFLVKKSRE